jgi:hypothetical protein
MMETKGKISIEVNEPSQEETMEQRPMKIRLKTGIMAVVASR